MVFEFMVIIRHQAFTRKLFIIPYSINLKPSLLAVWGIQKWKALVNAVIHWIGNWFIDDMRPVDQMVYLSLHKIMMAFEKVTKHI